MTPTELAQLRADAQFLLAEFHMPNEAAVHRLARNFIAANRKGDELPLSPEWIHSIWPGATPVMLEASLWKTKLFVEKETGVINELGLTDLGDGYFAWVESHDYSTQINRDYITSRKQLLSLLAGLGLEAKERG